MGCCMAKSDEDSLENHYAFTKAATLGTGGFARVEKATDKKTKALVAIKIIDITKLTKGLIDLILTEVSIMKELDHVNIIKCYNFFKKPQEYYVVMELMEGGELFDRIANRQLQSEHDARMVMKDILGALAYMHERGIMHRDIKPENLLCATQAATTSVKLADFGFASHVVGEKPSVICGTPDYIAPEMLKRQPYGVQVDTWSMGVILYILLCGYAPFQAEKTQILFAKIKKGNFVFHDQYWKSVSDLAKDFVMKLIAVEPSCRLTAGAALEHPWMLQTPSSLEKFEISELNMKTFKRFNAKRKIMAAARAIIMINRMKKGFGNASSDTLAGENVNPMLVINIPNAPLV